LPLLGAGKSLRFAFLPDGQDPDDLARNGGSDAVLSVLNAAKPLADVLWARESEAGPLDTPERRAALERRLATIVRTIGDETLRRYYLDDMRGRLDGMRGNRGSRREPAQARRPGQPWTPSRGGGRFQPPGAAQGYRFSPLSLSSSFAKSSTMAQTGGISRREAHILLLFTSHPGLLARHVEDLASLEFLSREACRLRDALTTLSADRYDSDIELCAALDDLGLAADRQKVEAMVAVASLWVVKPEAAEEDAEAALKQALALHRRAIALHRELKSAEIALAEDANEQNVARLREIQTELGAIDGREAAVEGFGFMSGRQGRSL
jgi:DNA primase